MQTDDSEIEVSVVNTIASVNINSDSLSENFAYTMKNRKRKKKHPNRLYSKNIVYCNADATSMSSSSKVGIRLDLIDSHPISELSSSSSSDNVLLDGRDADDEQSDWHDAPCDPSQIKLSSLNISGQYRRPTYKAEKSTKSLRHKLKQFIHEENQEELVLSTWSHFHRIYLEKFLERNRLPDSVEFEVTQRCRRTLVVKKIRHPLRYGQFFVDREATPLSTSS